MNRNRTLSVNETLHASMFKGGAPTREERPKSANGQDNYTPTPKSNFPPNESLVRVSRSQSSSNLRRRHDLARSSAPTMTTVKIALILLLAVIGVKSFRIRKCCPPGESLDESISCNKNENSTSDWIPEDRFVVHASNSTQKISNSATIVKELYKSSVKIGFPECDSSVYDITLVWDEVALTKGFYLLYDSVKSQVFLNFHRKSAHHENATLSFSRFFLPESYCVDVGPENSHMVVLCPCNNVTCIRKCCHENQVYDEASNDCVLFDVEELKNHTYHDWTPKFEKTAKKNNTEDPEYFLLIGKLPPCGEERGLYKNIETHDDSFLHTSDGTVKVNTTSVFQLPSDEYCGDFSWNPTKATLERVILGCFSKTVVENRMESQKSIPFYTFLMIIAVLLLLASALVLFFRLNPDIEGKRGATPILNHVSNLVVANTVTIISYLNTDDSAICLITGFVMQFSFLASFFWLNVMCVDMSWTFSGIRPPSGSRKERERRKFIWYSLYAWGGASALTLAAIIVEFVPGVPEKSPYKPNFGVISCWFKENEALWLYFYGPMGILLLSNLGLFVYTSFRIILLKRGTGALRQAESAQHGSRRNKQRFVLYAKLFLLMGVTWLTEIISWIVGTEGSNALNYLWYITDAINLLRAVFIFIIFCWKPRVWSNIKKKFPCTKRCEEFFIRTCCRREPTPDAQEEQKTSSTNGGQKDTSENGVEMENK